VLVTAAASDEVLKIYWIYVTRKDICRNCRIDGGEMCEMFDLLGLVLDGRSVYCFCPWFY
jgi:hypothetical protein